MSLGHLRFRVIRVYVWVGSGFKSSDIGQFRVSSRVFFLLCFISDRVGFWVVRL
jgi:hypothetical protein